MLAFKAVQGASWLIISRFAGKFIDFFTLLVLARILTPSDFGIAALSMSLVAVVDTVLEVPVTQALLRLDTIDRSHLDTGFTLSIIRSALIAVIVFCAVWPFSIFNHNPALVPLVAVLTVGPIVKGFYSPAMVNFARDLGFRQTFYMEFSGKFVAFFVTIATVALGGGYWAIALNFSSNCIVAAIMSYVLAPYRPALSLSRFSDFSGFIGWFSSSQLISALNWQFDRVFIGAVTDSTTLGRYAVASDVAGLPSQSIIGPAMQPVMSAFSRIAGDIDRMRLAFLKAARFAMLISLPICVGISLTADLVTEVLLGAKWNAAAPTLSILAISVVTIPYFQTLYSASVALNRPNILFKMNATDLFFRILLISAGIYIYSYIGASIGRVILSVIMFAFYLVEVRSLLSLSILTQLQNLWKMATATAVMAAIVLALRHQLATQGLNHVVEIVIVSSVGAAAYAIALLVLGMRISIGRGRFEISDNI